MKKKETPLGYIIDGRRTPIGSPYKSLKDISATQMAVFLIKDLVRRNKLKKTEVDQVILGNTVSAGLGQNFTRNAVCSSGLSYSVNAFSVNSVCGSGLRAIITGVQNIQTNNADVVIAGGAESASQSPYLILRKEAEDLRENNTYNPFDSLYNDGLFCRMTNVPMGELAESLASVHKISRERQDAYALGSYRKSLDAHLKKYWSREILPVAVHNKKISKDDSIRKEIDISMLERFPPVFWSGGSVTAGNSSAACDGAAAVVLASERYVKEKKIKNCFGVLGYATAMVDPAKTFESPPEAVNACLKKSKLSIDDIDLFEIGEAFAAQMIYTIEALKLPEHKTNVFGGDIALGHPLGTAGARIVVTLMNALTVKKKKIGLACIPYGGGGATAIILSRKI